MRQSLINKLCCPFDKSDLNLKVFVTDASENIIEGLMTCPTCHRYYPIAYGVPIMTPDEYRERYGLKADYPMVSEGYSEVRRGLAKKIGLGRMRSAPAVATPEPVKAKPGRKAKVSKPTDAE